MKKNLLLILVPIITLTSNAQTDNKIIIDLVDTCFDKLIMTRTPDS